MRFVILIIAFVVGWLAFDVVKAKADVRIVIDISEQTMWVGTPDSVYEWEVSTARRGYYTPRGVFQPTRLAKMHYSKKYDNAPMPNSIFFLGGYAIHATYDVKNLGRPASHGCVRLHPQNAQWLFQLVNEYGAENTFIQIQD